MTVKEFAAKYNVSVRRVQFLISQGRIPAEEVLSEFNHKKCYDIPADAVYPDDERFTHIWGTRYRHRRLRRPSE